MRAKTLLVGALGLSLACVSVQEEPAPTEDATAGGKADSVDDSIPPLIAALAKVLHPVVQVACRGRTEAHRITCWKGTELDEDADGRKDGGIWPLTIYDADGVRRVVGKEGLNVQQCDCYHQSGLRACSELDVDLLAAILDDIVEYYSTEYLGDLIADLVRGDDEVDDDEFDDFPWDDLDEEETEVPYEDDRDALLLGMLVQAAEAAGSDFSFETPSGACECRGTTLPCEDGQAPFCEDRVCVECRSDVHCSDGTICELGACISG